MRQLIFFRVVIRFSQKTTQSKTYKVVTTSRERGGRGWEALRGLEDFFCAASAAEHLSERSELCEAADNRRAQKKSPPAAPPPIPFPLSHGVHPTKAIVHPTKKQPSFRRTHDKSKTVFRFFTKKTSPICETPPSSSPEDPISASGYADSSE